MVEAEAPAVATAGLCRTYRTGLLGRGRVEALRDLTLTASAGETIGVVGANGSGKSTLLRCLVGLERPDGGTVSVLGETPGRRRIRRRVGYVSEARLPLGRLTAREFLTLSGTLAGCRLRAARRRCDELLERFALAGASGRGHGEFSTGMERRLAFAAALFHEPHVLVLDEPTAGLDPIGAELVSTSITARVAGGAVAIIATHALDDFGAGDFGHLLVLRGGRAAAQGSPDEILGLDSHWDVRVRSQASSLDQALGAMRATGVDVIASRAARRSLHELLADIERRGE